MQRGFTLLETIVVVALAVLVFSAVLASIWYVLRAQEFAFESADALLQARKGMKVMVAELREAAYSDVGDYPLQDISSTSITFFSDVDRDSKIERVRYWLAGEEVFRGELESSGTPPTYNAANEQQASLIALVYNAAEQKPLFRYFDAKGNEVTDPAAIRDVRYVIISLITNANPARAPEPYEIRSAAALRNVK